MAKETNSGKAKKLIEGLDASKLESILLSLSDDEDTAGRILCLLGDSALDEKEKDAIDRAFDRVYLGFKEQGWGERKFSNELIKLFSEVSERLSSRELYSEAAGYAVLALDTAECAFTLEDGYERFDPEPLMKEIMKGLKALRKKLGFQERHCGQQSHGRTRFLF